MLSIFVKEPVELSLLEVANENLSLLRLSHLAKLPELVLLKHTKGFEVRDPLLSDLLVIYILRKPFGVARRVEGLPPHDI